MAWSRFFFRVEILVVLHVLLFHGTQASSQPCNNAFLENLPTASFSASSEYKPSNTPPDRYDAQHSKLSDRYAWCADRNKQNKDQWLQFDLGGVKTLTAVATQGHWQRWIKTYYVHYSFTGSTWATYQENGQDKLITGNTDATSIVSYRFTLPVVARYVRINPQSWRRYTSSGNYLFVCTKAELYGCSPSACSSPLGMESKVIPDSAITASSYAAKPSSGDPDDWYAPLRGRFNVKSMWCAHKDKQTADQYLQIDLGGVVTVSGVSTQGYWERRVKTYKISSSLDASTWTEYKDDSSSSKVFTGDDGKALDVVKFNVMAPTRARYIRFNPQTWRFYNPSVNPLHVCLKAEVYGCSNAKTYPVCSGALLSTLADSKFTASTTEPSFDNRYHPYRAKMNKSSAWCAKKDSNDVNQWLMVDLGEAKVITGVATKGDDYKQTTSYFIEYSNDSTTWSTYQENNKDRV